MSALIQYTQEVVAPEDGRRHLSFLNWHTAELVQLTIDFLIKWVHSTVLLVPARLASRLPTDIEELRTKARRIPDFEFPNMGCDYYMRSIRAFCRQAQDIICRSLELVADSPIHAQQLKCSFREVISEHLSHLTIDQNANYCGPVQLINDEIVFVIDAAKEFENEIVPQNLFLLRLAELAKWPVVSVNGTRFRRVMSSAIIDSWGNSTEALSQVKLEDMRRRLKRDVEELFSVAPASRQKDKWLSEDDGRRMLNDLEAFYVFVLNTQHRAAEMLLKNDDDLHPVDHLKSDFLLASYYGIGTSARAVQEHEKVRRLPKCEISLGAL